MVRVSPNLVKKRMQANQAWIALFQRIPIDLHDTLALGMATGAEIVVQRIVKLEPDFMIIRGRLAGTQDTGRVVMVPYPQLTFVAIQRDLTDSDVEGIFGKGAPPGPAGLPPMQSAAKAMPEPEDQRVVAADSKEEVAAKKKPEAVSKTVLLAKLRERLKDAGPGK